MLLAQYHVVNTLITLISVPLKFILEMLTDKVLTRILCYIISIEDVFTFAIDRRAFFNEVTRTTTNKHFSIRVVVHPCMHTTRAAESGNMWRQIRAAADSLKNYCRKKTRVKKIVSKKEALVWVLKKETILIFYRLFSNLQLSYFHNAQLHWGWQLFYSKTIGPLCSS